MTASPPAGLAAEVRRRLLPWFARRARALPWRRRRTPYTAWVAEMMLQQTRVDQALPYYRRWLRRFPSVRALAAADLQAVLKAWEGLGYYARARNMHAAARRVTSDLRGRWPVTAAEWAALPGVGPYTAAALASLLHNEPVAVLDGNVARVLCRLRAAPLNPRSGAARRTLRAWADELLPADRAGAHNEAMMELGALVCRPRRPGCGVCPLRTVCAGFASGDPHAYPAAPPRKKLPHLTVGAAVLRDRRGRVLITQRRTEDMLGGLWEFPGGKREPGETMEQCIARELREELGITAEVGAPVAVVRHAYSHFTIELHAHAARLRRGRPCCLHCADFAWVAPDRLRVYPFSKADLLVLDAVCGRPEKTARPRRGRRPRR